MIIKNTTIKSTSLNSFTKWDNIETYTTVIFDDEEIDAISKCGILENPEIVIKSEEIDDGIDFNCKEKE